MPARERSFGDDLPDQLYLDTDFGIACLIDTQPHHARCRAFMTRLEEQPSDRALRFLPLLGRTRQRRDEGAITRKPPRGRTQPLFRLGQWQDAAVRQTYLESMLGAFDAILEQFSWDEIALVPDVRLIANRYIARYRLSAHDAVHAASAEYAGVADLAALDEAYRRVDGIVLWNDLIHAGKPVRGPSSGG